MIYYIYRIPRTNKIGCTNNLKERVEKQQGCFNYEILYKTEDINKASDKEIELQKKYGYKLDRIPYNKLKIHKMGEIHQTSGTTTFKSVFEKSDFKNYYSDLKELDLTGLGTVKINNDIFNFIESKLKKSQYNNLGMYINNATLWNYYNVNKEENTKQNNMFDNIRQWAKDKGILEKGDSKTQYIKLQEEAGELAKAILNNDRPEIIDAIGDCVVVLTNLAALEELKIEDCINSAYNVISKRTGEMKNGTFVKEDL